MKFAIKQPQFLHESGQKSDNEDFIYPIEGKATTDSRLFIVSDGDRGKSKNKADHGGTASQLIAMGIATQFSNMLKEGDADQELLEKAVRHAQDSLTKYLERHPDSEGISASFSLVHFGETKVTVAWLGDCRVYHFNKNLKSVSSSDQWEADMESPSPEARLTGYNSSFQVRSRYYAYEDLHAGDHFFIASSGMDQEVHESSLKSVFNSTIDHAPEQVMAEISNLIVGGLAQENYSAYLIPVGLPVGGIEPVKAGGVSDSAERATKETAAIGGIPEDPGGKRLGWILGSVFGAAVILLLAFAYLETQDKPFEKLMTAGDKHLEAGKNANTNIDFQGASEEFDLARAAYDSAVTLASTEEERLLVIARQNELETFRKPGPVMTLNLVEVPLEDLTQTPRQYIKDGEAFFDAQNYPAALQAFRNAERLLAATPDAQIELPSELIAQSYAAVANSNFAAAERDCQQILSYYRLAFEYFQPNADDEHPEWYKNAQINAGSCDATLAAAQEDSAQASDQKPRSLTPETASEAIASATREPVSDGSSASRRVAPATAATPNSSTASSNQRVRGATNPSVNAAELAEMKRLLSEGKRQYVEAKNQNSAFLYAASVDKLTRSAQALDGPGAYLLAYMHHSGLGVQSDDEKALEYAQLSARKKWPAGEYLYAHLLLERKNKRDTITAVSSLKMAANQFFNDAIERLNELGVD